MPFQNLKFNPKISNQEFVSFLDSGETAEDAFVEGAGSVFPSGFASVFSSEVEDLGGAPDGEWWSVA